MTQAEGPLTIDELRSLVAAGTVDTVVIAITDMQGRLQGKRCGAKYFLDVVVPHAAEGCNYLLAVDVDMNTVGGYAMSSWESGYGDFVFKPDLSTLRLMPWHEGSALVLCDLQWEDGQSRRCLAAADPAPADRAAGRARARPLRWHRTRVHAVQRRLRGRLGQGLPPASARQPVQRRLLAHRHRASRARSCAASAMA